MVSDSPTPQSPVAANASDDGPSTKRVPELVEQISHQYPLRLPRATYRVQINSAFTLFDAAELVPTLAALGISHLYLSPILTARPGSAHGYDIVDHGRINPEYGGADGFAALCNAAREHGIGLILDVVPNHMCVASSANQWWVDVLRNGQSSPYADYFDIDWRPIHPDLQNRVLYPVLGASYGAELESGRLRLAYDNGEFFIRYYDFVLPIDITSYRLVLQTAWQRVAGELGQDNPHRMELESILRAIEHVPPHSVAFEQSRADRRREQLVIRRRLQHLEAASPAVSEAIRLAAQTYNGEPGNPASFDRLDELLRQQPYRLAFWMVATDEINYRRFFDVNDLAAIRVELPTVFDETHRLLFQLFDTNVVAGWRIDHVDGLFDPAEYLKQVQGTRLLQLLQAPFSPLKKGEALAVLQSWDEATRAANLPRYYQPMYLVVEKILEPGESIPSDWPVHGTTGYDFLNTCNGIFVNPASRTPMTRLYQRFTGRTVNFEQLLYECKIQVMETSMSAELQVLGHLLDRISEADRWSRDFTRNSLTDAIREVVACFPVYRTYINGPQVSERDRRYIEAAVREARRRNPALSKQTFDFVRDCLLVRPPRKHSPITVDQLVAFVRKFQQFTGPVMAKGMEDTAFYRYNRLVSLNEVGGEPRVFGTSVRDFHAANVQRQSKWPFSMLATSTHDTKRSEDVRCRINVLSELVADWHRHVYRWARWNRPAKTMVGGELAPSRNDEYLLYQTLVGTWPVQNEEDWSSYVERIAAYMLKATREAKQYTSWTSPDPAYEEAVQQFTRRVLDRAENPRFVDSIEEFARTIAFFGAWNSLCQVLLKATSPGVPDFYQGTERWNFSLVDPDNRRPVDFSRTRALLEQLLKARRDRERVVATVVDDPFHDLAKLFVTHEALQERRRNPLLYTLGSYTPLQCTGHAAGHVVAFSRSHREEQAVIVAPRLVATLTGGAPVTPVGETYWAGTSVILPPESAGRTLVELFTGRQIYVRRGDQGAELRLAEVFARFPLALLRTIGDPIRFGAEHAASVHRPSAPKD